MHRWIQPEIHLGKREAQTSLGFRNTNRSLELSQTNLPNNRQKKKKKKRTCLIAYFAVPAEFRLKFKENKKRNTYVDLAIEQQITIKYDGDGVTNS